jgi:DNA modification methylase
MSDCRIITGDDLDAMDRMEPRSARLVFADPPYNTAASSPVPRPPETS